MKNIKEHKVQILAAIALAFALGVMAPSATFASEGTSEAEAGEVEGGIEAYSQESDQEAAQKLYSAYVQAVNDSQYTAYKNLREAQDEMSKKLSTASTAEVLNVAQLALAVDSEAKVAGLDAAALNAYILKDIPNYNTAVRMLEAVSGIQTKVGASVTADAIYANVDTADVRSYTSAIEAFNNRIKGTLTDNLYELGARIVQNNAFATFWNVRDLIASSQTLSNPDIVSGGDLQSARTTLVTELKKWLPSEGATADMEDNELVAIAKKLPGYNDYLALYDAWTAFQKATGVTTNTVVPKDKIEALAENVRMTNYLALYNAAAAISAETKEALAGLPNYGSLPDTSVPGADNSNGNEENKPSAPNSGIVGLFESGAIDAATLTLIVAVVVAGLAGVGVIAKLYLKHRF